MLSSSPGGDVFRERGRKRGTRVLREREIDEEKERHSHRREIENDGEKKRKGEIGVAR